MTFRRPLQPFGALHSAPGDCAPLVPLITPLPPLAPSLRPCDDKHLSLQLLLLSYKTFSCGYSCNFDMWTLGFDKQGNSTAKSWPRWRLWRHRSVIAFSCTSLSEFVPRVERDRNTQPGGTGAMAPTKFLAYIVICALRGGIPNKIMSLA